MKLLRYMQRDVSKDGVLHEGRIFPLRRMDIAGALASLQEDSPEWHAILEQPSLPLADARLLPPVAAPGAFLDFYTFEEHVKTARKKRGLDMVPEWRLFPVWYNGSTRCFSGHESTVYFPENENKKDFELELAIVIKKKGTRISVAEADGFIGGYTILNDFSARELQEKVMRVGLGPAKAKDFNTGLGPCIVTPDAIGNPRNLRMRAWVNEELWTEGNSGASHFTFAQMIAYASEYQHLFPGDILASGAVGGGCGLELDRFLRSGDKVTLEVENIGQLTHWIG